MSPDGRIVYVPNSDSDSVSVIDVASNTVTRTFRTGGYPTRIAVSPDGRRIYVTSVFDNALETIDTSSGTTIAKVKTGDYPTDVVLSPDGTRAYVTNSNSEDVAVIDTTANTRLARIRLRKLSEAIAMSPDGSRAYALVTARPSAIAVIDTSTNLLSHTIKLGRWATDIVISPDGQRAYVTTSADVGGQGRVEVVDLVNRRVTSSIALGQFPGQMSLGDAGKRLYVTNMGTNTWGSKRVGSNGLVSVIDTGTRAVLGSVQATGPSTFGQQLSGIAVTADGATAYSALGGTHRVAVMTVSPVPATPTQPVRVSMRPSGATARVSWQPPASSGGSAIVRYGVTAIPMAEGPGPSSTCVSTGTSCRVTKLLRGVYYLVAVQALNAQGWGPAGTTTLVKVP